MRQSRWTVLAVALVVSGACGGGEAGPSGEVVPWSLDGGVVDIGDGIPFCEAAMARVAEYMGQFEGQVPADERYGGTAVVAAIGPIPGGMNAHVSADQGGNEHQTFINLMTLIKYDTELNAVPYLAQSWEVSDDNTQLTFHLRNDVYWHDGELTDAYDVAYTYQRAIDPETGFPQPAFWAHYDQDPGGVEVVDSFTVRFRMRPHAEFLDPWREFPIMPQHLLEGVPSAELRQHPYGDVCPVGNGPFVFIQHQQGANWTFQANPAFPAGLGGRPFLDRYIYQIIVEPTTILTALLTENIDVYIAPTPDQVQTILDSDDLDLRVYPYRQINFVTWNARPPQLSDKRVRQAITKGTDRRQIVEALFGTYARVPNTTLPSSHWAYDASIGAETMAYDPEAASALLAEAGWIDRDGDGVRENAQGLRLSIELIYSQNALRQQVVEIMQAQLSEIGIEAQPTVLAYSALLDRIFDTEARDFDGIMIAFTMSFKADDTDFFHSDNIDNAFGFSGTQRADMDALLERLPLIVDREEAKPVWKEYQELLVDEQPWMFAYDANRFDGVNKRLQGVVMDARGEWQNVKDWWIPADQRKGPGR